MKLKTAIKYIVISLLLFLPFVWGFKTGVFAFTDDVVITANIDQDLYSEVTLSPTTVEVSQPSTVTVRVLSASGTPIAGRTVELIGSGLAITQPVGQTGSNGIVTGLVSSSTTGTFEVCAKDTTFDYDIVIHDCAVLYVVPVITPVMLPEPYYTKGLSNIVLWNSLGSGYQYSVQASRASDFSTIFAQALWVSNTSHEFVNLENGQMYFYRVRARNLYGGVSNWSSSVFSVQDNEAPSIELLNVGDIGENDTMDWTNSYEVVIRTLIKDNLKLDTVRFFCVNQDGTTYECGSMSSSGDNYDFKIRLDDLERDRGVYLFTDYDFCIEANDEAGNVNRVCDISLVIPQGSSTPVTPPTPGEEPNPNIPSDPTIIDRIGKSIDDVTTVIDDIVGDLPSSGLQTITTTASVVTVSTGFALLASSLWEIPYLVFQMFLTFLSWLGFRKKGKRLGFVYNSITKEPVSQAVVRIFNEESKMVWSDVTDAEGSFNAELDDGKYRMSVRSSKHEFPSNVVFGREDFPLIGVYHGEFFNVVESNPISFSIPVDPLEVSRFRVLVESLWSRLKFVSNILHVILFVGGLVLSVYAYSRNSSWLNFIVILLFVPSFFLLIQNVFKKRSRYGVIRDIEGKPLANVVVGLREVEFEKLVAKRVTGDDGKYRFFVNEGKYEIEILETGFRVNSITDGYVIDTDKDKTLVARDIVLERID